MKFKHVFLVLAALLLAACSTPTATPVPTAPPLPTPKVVVLTPTAAPISRPASIVDLANIHLGHTITKDDDIAAIVEPVEGLCDHAACVAEIYLDTQSILNSEWLGTAVRSPGTAADIVWGTHCEILSKVNGLHYLDWETGDKPPSVIITGWPGNVAVLGWNWYSTRFTGPNPNGFDSEEFWNHVWANCKGG